MLYEYLPKELTEAKRYAEEGNVSKLLPILRTLPVSMLLAYSSPENVYRTPLVSRCIQALKPQLERWEGKLKSEVNAAQEICTKMMPLKGGSEYFDLADRFAKAIDRSDVYYEEFQAVKNALKDLNEFVEHEKIELALEEKQELESLLKYPRPTG